MKNWDLSIRDGAKMTNWTKTKALKELSSRIETTIELKNSKGYSAEHMRWQANCIELLEEVFGRESRYYLSFVHIEWRKTGAFIVGGPADRSGSMNPAAAIEREHQKAYIGALDAAKGLLQGAYDKLERSEIANVYEGKNTPPETSDILQIINLCDRQLRKIIRSKPDKEVEVQVALENLLIGAEIEYSRESVHIQFSSKSYIPDFTFSRIDLALEVKLCNRVGREKEIISEINDDILAYQTKYGNLLFVIYDNGYIRDIDRFKQDIEKSQKVVLLIIKH